jgi:hypothetical protein
MIFKLNEKKIREFASKKGTKPMLLIKSHIPGETDKVLTKAAAKKMVETGVFEIKVEGR